MSGPKSGEFVLDE